ncbi:MAG TPA: phosphotransferase [Candidatus Paceibacterota bacterium]|nr:phosphotransferase [Candidatus Paceibacterota bacterium]
MSLEQSKIELAEVGNELEKERQLRITHKAIEAIKENPAELGVGVSAFVTTFEDKDDVAFCLKQYRPTLRAENRPFNNLAREMHMMEEARRAGVRTPLPFFTIEIEHENAEGDAGSNLVSYLGMERIFGYTLDQVVVGKRELPENFDLERFMESLRDQVRRAHEQNLYHRDLHNGNLMIDWKTGNPVVIDWGQSRICFSHDDNPYEDPSWANTARREPYLDDDKSLRAYEIELKRHLGLIG